MYHQNISKEELATEYYILFKKTLYVIESMRSDKDSVNLVIRHKSYFLYIITNLKGSLDNIQG